MGKKAVKEAVVIAFLTTAVCEGLKWASYLVNDQLDKRKKEAKKSKGKKRAAERAS